MGAELDASALPGHLRRACLEHAELAKAPAATAAAAAIGEGVGEKAAGARKPAKSSRKKVASAAASWVMEEEEEEDVDLLGGGVDINGPAVQEIALLQVGVAVRRSDSEEI